MILENGPKTESCDSGIVVLSKHSSGQSMIIQSICCLLKSQMGIEHLKSMIIWLLSYAR